MSSHHFVRENQEPALLVLSLEGIPSAVLEGLLEWSPIVAATSETAFRLDELGVKIDVVFCANEADRREVESALAHQYPFKTEQVTEMALTDCLAFLETKNRVISMLGKAEIMESESYLKAAQQLELIAYLPQGKAVYCARAFEKWFPANQKISLYSFGPSASPRTENLRQLPNCLEVETEGLVSVKAESAFLVIEHYSE